MKALIDPEVCIGCTLCTQVCEDVFKMQEDKAAVYKDPVPAEDHECARSAAEQCPVQAITITQ